MFYLIKYMLPYDLQMYKYVNVHSFFNNKIKLRVTDNFTK